MNRCPKCESFDIVTEKRHGGDSVCRECNHKDKSLYFREKIQWINPEYQQTEAIKQIQEVLEYLLKDKII